MEVLFRTDSSIQIGSGHVMRCLTLAEGLKKKGASCKFICRDHEGNLISLIEEKGFKAIILKTPKIKNIKFSPKNNSSLCYSEWLGVPWEIDAKQTNDLIIGLNIDWLIVDHYALDSRWENAVTGNIDKVMIIDDLADRNHNCDLLLDQNLGKNQSDYYSLTPADCNILVGPKFALLRPEFSDMRPYSLDRRREPRLKNILISMGGIDKDNITSKVLDSLESCNLPIDCEINVLLGSNSPWIKELKRKASAMSWETNLKLNISNIAEEMSDSDIAIGAAGSTSWERCCLGLPSLVLVIADNQLNIAKALSAQGAAQVINIKFLENELHELFLNHQDLYEKMKKISSSSQELTMGNGTDIVIDLMHSFIK